MSFLDVVVYDDEGIFQTLVVAGIREVLEQTAYVVRVVALRKLPMPVYTHDADTRGVVIIANALNDPDIAVLQAQGIPLTLVSHETPFHAPSLRFNNAEGVAHLVRHLVQDCQRKTIAFVRGIMKQIDAQERELAFRRELMHYQLPIREELFLRGEFDPSIAVVSVQELLNRSVFFDAILASDYILASAIASMLRGRGVGVPQQIAVVGFGDAEEAEQQGITTVSADVQELGRRAARQILHQMGGAVVYGTTTLSVNLMVRASSVLV